MPDYGTKTYAAAIRRWADRTEEELTALARQSIYSLCFRIVVDTPVMFGVLRGGWQPSIGMIPPPKPVGENGAPADPTGAQAMADLAVKLQGLKLGDKFYFTNATVYARRIEYGFVGEDSLGRYYNQRGRYYVGNNVARWKVHVNDTARRLWGGKK